MCMQEEWQLLCKLMLICEQQLQQQQHELVVMGIHQETQLRVRSWGID